MAIHIYKKDGTVTSAHLNFHSVEDVINHIKDSHTPKTDMGFEVQWNGNVR
ncbi:hypothetical protein NUBL19415_49820 [Klebsiella pneumoniae]|nr:hypothetical protein NUBL19415_49820 [Klebsiella pneumoniae]